MGLIWTGFGALVVGVALIIAGDVIRRRQPAVRGGPSDPFFKWFGTVVRRAFKILTDPDAGPGEKVSAAGTIVAAAGVLLLVVGLLAELGGGD